MGKWEKAGEILVKAALQVQSGGADFLLICTNTMHKVAPQIEKALSIPLLHLADATAENIKARGLDTIGLLGTNFTMEQDFYCGRLQKHGSEVLIPSPSDCKRVHDIIYNELCLGTIQDTSRKEYLQIMERLRDKAGCSGDH